MRNGIPDRGELDRVVRLVAREAREYLDTVDHRPVLDPGATAAAQSFRRPLPSTGAGAPAALRELLDQGIAATATTTGPRFFHFVTGGTTPAALGADWLTGLLDQQAYTWVASPLAVELELVALDWLRELFGLHPDMAGVMTTGASMANFVGLAAARQWWAGRHGVDVAESGLRGLPPMPVFSSGYIHASSVKVLAMLGVGRQAVRRFERDDAGRLDLDALRSALRALDGSPAVLVAAAGEVNAGDSDPIAAMADLAEEYGAWLHVDGAFGLFAALSPRTADQVAGVDRADSVTSDGHKWLNVPYDCGFAFVRDRTLLARAFAYTADYLPDPADPRPTMGAIGPESSRRARSLAVWATLRAYGRDGYRALVERHLDLARLLGRRVDEAPELERLADVPLNIVCFRFAPAGRSEPELDELNRRLGERILEDGRFYAGTTRYRGRVALRPALVNWRTGEADVELFVEVVRELAAEVDREIAADVGAART
ncbi:MAG: aspartate aminotransferase family protein [Gemmatimonadetes bacterium]|nr:aspartate aminotransferase family protein [Gemmatimonadota bacterium]NIQ54567.1 aspartate aminotransferase family protein [Gemmatimonadota bacterium]NIU74770.1 aspartate aminotransferase family protein [Gammaproteobacteria bacterium]NIX44676.1 aspartate aminotransferase family protein [Gemmatimonadota bacterium]NIY08911.1 aspartate aminotransferase family protein [Gemmatimonadota bacterium]